MIAPALARAVARPLRSGPSWWSAEVDWEVESIGSSPSMALARQWNRLRSEEDGEAFTFESNLDPAAAIATLL